MLEAIRDLENKLSSKFSITFKINSKESDIKINFPTPLLLDGKLNYELGLSWFTTYNSIYNINELNNMFVITKIGIHEITPGAYEVPKISEEMNKIICKALGKEVDPKSLQFELLSNIPTGKCLMKNKEDISFSKGLASVLGFKSDFNYKKVNI